MPFQEIGRRCLWTFDLSATDTADILADALTALYAGGLAQFRGGTVAELIGFLKAVVRNRAIDFVKERNKWVSADAQADGRADEAAGAGSWPEPFDVSGELADQECLEFLRQEIEKLRRDDRELYLMKARGLKEREIVEQTGRPPGTVSSQIARMLDRLRAALKARGCL